MKKQYIKDIKPNDKIDTLLAVKTKYSIREYKNGYMFTLSLTDKTGNILAKFWGDNNKIKIQKTYDIFQKGDIVNVKGTANEYQGNTEISINENHEINIKKIDNYDVTDFVPTTDTDINEIINELKETIRTIKNPHLIQLLNKIILDKEIIEKAKITPASIGYHDSCAGGLLVHTYNVVRICDTLAKVYSGLDRDLLLTSAILHDIGKTFEYSVSTTMDYTEDGIFKGHIIIGYQLINEKIDQISEFPQEIKQKLLHIILSHHGEKAFGSPKRPVLAEGVALHFADYCDSQVSLFIQVQKETKTEDKWIYDKRLGKVYLK